MSAVYSSSIAPLPHQILAVYEDMLPKVPLRFLLADDPGAGKTIMAGLYIREMLLRSAAERVIVVCPDVRWDIAVVDEAHRMSAHYRNAYDEINRTRRFALAAFPARELLMRRRRERRRKAKTR